MKVKRAYWPRELDTIIHQYNTTKSAAKRERLFRTHLHAPIKKLVECLGRKFRAGAIQETDEYWGAAIGYLITKFQNYTPDKGKSFSYFTVIMKHYFWTLNKNTARDIKRLTRLDGWASVDICEFFQGDPRNQDDPLNIKQNRMVKFPKQLLVPPPEVVEPEPFPSIINHIWHCTKCIPKHKKTKDQDIRTAISILYRDVSLGNYNAVSLTKKFFFEKIRALTGCETVHITKTVSRIKKCMSP